MIFSSLVFLCIFLPVVLLLYYVVPGIKIKNGLLICASLLFYAYGEPVYVLLMIGSAVLNYAFAILIDKYEKQKKVTLIAAIVANIGVLCFFKYTGFLLTSINSVFGSSIPVPEITLPIGISFFTFQALSYVIDVYQKKVDVQKNFFYVLLYISFFPQLIAGPIVKYRDISEEITNRKLDTTEIAAGFRRFIWGLAKKVLIANAVGLAVDNIFAAPMNKINVATAWIAAVAYILQIYYDFSGYSDMAIGLGKMFGFHFKENFEYPYGATSIKDFWRRWHISLSTWFKEYLYIPLGGNRKGQLRACINRIIVFFFTGLWHGANWTFVVWGLWHGFFLLLETYIPITKKLPKFVSRIYTLLVVCLGFVIFRAENMSQGVHMIGKMFTGFDFGSTYVSFMMQQLTPWFIVMAIVGVLFAAPFKILFEKLKTLTAADEKVACALNVVSLVLLCWCLIRLSGSTYNPFIYFRF